MLSLVLAGCTCYPGIIPLQYDESENLLRLDGAILTVTCEEKYQ